MCIKICSYPKYHKGQLIQVAFPNLICREEQKDGYCTHIISRLMKVGLTLLKLKKKVH